MVLDNVHKISEAYEFVVKIGIITPSMYKTAISKLIIKFSQRGNDMCGTGSAHTAAISQVVWQAEQCQSPSDIVSVINYVFLPNIVQGNSL